MTEPARQMPIGDPRTGTFVPDNSDMLLPLKGNVPVTVNVRLGIGADGKPIVLFSQPGSTFEFTGLSWSCAGYSLMITFVILDDSDPLALKIVELRPETPSFWFTDTFQQLGEKTRRQACCVPPTPGIYHFHAQLESGKLIDPRMVVTPITA